MKRSIMIPIGLPVLAVVMAVAGADSKDLLPTAPGPGSEYRGTLTFARDGSGDPFSPQLVVDYDLSTEKLAVRFNGFDAQRTATGESAFLQRLTGGYIADYGVVAADARGVPSAPVFVCRSYSFSSNRICHTPKLSPDGKLVAFGAAGGGGSVCKNGYDMFWADYVIVSRRSGGEVRRFEGYYHPEWLPDGRLVLMGSACRNAGVWVADASLRTLTRVDGGQIATPAAMPAANPDGKRVAIVWNNQLWQLTLDGAHELTQLTQLEKAVSAAAWSPDGRALAAVMFDVSMPVRALVLFRPGDDASVEVRQLGLYPFGPISWH
jgi:WD40 repeat protein